SELQIVLHDARDLALVRAPGAPRVALPWARETAVAPGDLVEVAGYGLDEDGAAGALRFAAARVASVGDGIIEVAALDGSAPCGGDWGGPLLVRGADGRVAVAGLLSQGSPACAGPDAFEDVGSAAAWIEAQVGPPAADAQPCTALGAA